MDTNGKMNRRLLEGESIPAQNPKFNKLTIPNLPL